MYLGNPDRLSLKEIKEVLFQRHFYGDISSPFFNRVVHIPECSNHFMDYTEQCYSFYPKARIMGSKIWALQYTHDPYHNLVEKNIICVYAPESFQNSQFIVVGAPGHLDSYMMTEQVMYNCPVSYLDEVVDFYASIGNDDWCDNVVFGQWEQMVRRKNRTFYVGETVRIDVGMVKEIFVKKYGTEFIVHQDYPLRLRSKNFNQRVILKCKKELIV